MDTVNLNKLKIGLRQSISQYLLDAGVEAYYDALSDHIIVELRGYIFSEDVGEHIVRYPKDWWQSFKERWFSGWMLKKWPVEYKEQTFSFKVTYPEFRPSMPKEKHYYRIMTQ